jgi:COMPASS component SWD3
LAVWDVATGQKCFTNSLGGGDIIVSISGKSETLAAANEQGVVELWNLRTFEPQGSITGHVGQIWSMAFSPDSQILAIGSKTNGVELWDFQIGVKRASLKGQHSAVSRLAFTSDGRTLVAGTENELNFWDMETLGKNKTLSGSGHGLTIAPSGRLLAAGNFAAGIKLRALPELEELLTIKGHKEEIWSLAFSPDSKTLATASWDGTVKLWHVATGQELFSFDAGGGVAWWATFSPDSRLLAFGSGSYQKEEIALVRAATEADVQQAKQDKLAGDEGVLRERLRGGRADDPLLDGLLVLLLQNLLDQQKFADAEIVARQSLANREKNQPDKWLIFNTRSVLGGILLELKKYAEAEPFLLAGYAGLKEREDVLPAAGKACLTVSLRRLVQLYEATAQPEKAAEWKKLIQLDQAKAEK